MTMGEVGGLGEVDENRGEESIWFKDHWGDECSIVSDHTEPVTLDIQLVEADSSIRLNLLQAKALAEHLIAFVKTGSLKLQPSVGVGHAGCGKVIREGLFGTEHEAVEVWICSQARPCRDCRVQVPSTGEEVGHDFE